MSQVPPSEAPLKRSLLAAFTLPTLILGFMHGPEGQIQAIYAKHAGLALGALALAMLVGKILDAVTYPLIGYLSDRSYARRGTRMGWIIAGTVISTVGVWFLLRPPPGVSVLYFGVWMTVTYIGWKLMEIPLQAWSYGLSTDYAQQSRIQAWRVLSTLIGQLLFFATPYLAVKLGYSDSTELDFRSLGVAAVICVVLLPLATMIAVARVPRGQAAPDKQAAAKRFNLGETWRAVRDNRPLIRLLAAFIPVNLLALMSSGVVYLFVDSYLGLSKQFPALMAISLLTTVGGVPFWTMMAMRYERHRVWAVSLLVGGGACVACAFLTPGPGALPMTFVLFPILMFSLSGVVLVFSMCADIVDYGKLHNGEDLSGLYASLLFFLQKSLGGLSTAAGIALVGAFGFEASAAVQSANAVFGIKLASAVLPAIGLIGAAAVIWNYPLDRARAAELRAALQANGRQAA